MKQVPWLCLLGLLSWPLAGTAGVEPEASPRPNIVFILMDDLRWDDLGCMGHPFVKTPAHRPDRPRGGPVPQRLRDDAALLPQPRQLPDRPVSPCPRGARQRRPQRPESSARDMAAAAPRAPATRRATWASGTWATTTRAGPVSTTGSA